MNFCRLLLLFLPVMASAQTGLYVPAGGSFNVGDGTVGRPALLDQEVSRGRRAQWGSPLEPLRCGWVVHLLMDFFCVVAIPLIPLSTPNCIHSCRRICPAIRRARSLITGDTFPGAMAVVV